MRMHGQTVTGDYRKGVLLPRPDGSVWALTLTPLRLGFQQWLQTQGVLPPRVPTRLVRDAQGRVQRDAEGQVLLQRDDQDADYLCQMQRYHQRVATLMFWEAIKQDPQIEWGVLPPESSAGSEWCDFADALMAEMEQAGFLAGDLLWLCEQILQLSHLAGQHLQEQQQSFSRAGQAVATT
jgi:hypothetical protein